MISDISVYVHVPFCSRKCVYCDFTSLARDDLFDLYFERLYREVELLGDELSDRRIVTVYFGGGTPSHVPTKYIANVLEILSGRFRYEPAEISFEFNPEDVTPQLCATLKGFGINRASVGLQTSSNDLLRTLGRPYDLGGFMRSYETLKKTFDNVNVDLMYGLPFESFKDVEEDLKEIETLKPDHVSFYELELHESVPLYSMIQSGNARLPSEDLSEKMYETIVKKMETIGYSRYELSSWTAGKRCLHNVRYWKNDDYLGLGLSAGGHVGKKRWVNTNDFYEYITKIRDRILPRTYENENSLSEEAAETLFMALRLTEGVNVLEMNEKFGSAFEELHERLKKFCGELLECSENLRFTKVGMKFSAMVLRELT